MNHTQLNYTCHSITS